MGALLRGGSFCYLPFYSSNFTNKLLSDGECRNVRFLPWSYCSLGRILIHSHRCTGLISLTLFLLLLSEVQLGSDYISQILGCLEVRSSACNWVHRLGRVLESRQFELFPDEVPSFSQGIQICSTISTWPSLTIVIEGVSSSLPEGCEGDCASAAQILHVSLAA